MKNGQFHQRTRICKDKNENKSLVKILELQNSKSEIQNSIKGLSRPDRRESTLEVENIHTKIQRGKRLKKKIQTRAWHTHGTKWKKIKCAHKLESPEKRTGKKLHTKMPDGQFNKSDRNIKPQIEGPLWTPVYLYSSESSIISQFLSLYFLFFYLLCPSWWIILLRIL